MYLFRKPVLKEKTERLKRIFRIDKDFVRLALIQEQIRVWIDSEPPLPDIIKRLAARKRFYGETANTRPIVLRRIFVNDEAEVAERVWGVGGAGTQNSWFQGDRHKAVILPSRR